MVFVAFGGVDVDLRREVASGVHFIVHVEGGVLRVAEVVGGVGEVNAFRQTFFVVAAGEHALAFFAVDNSRAGVLAEGKLALGCHLGVAEHREGDKFVVFACFGVGEDFSHHGVVLAAEHESVVVCALACKHCEGLGVDNEEFVSAPVLNFHVVGSEVIIFCGVFANGEHRLVFERFCCHKIVFVKRFDKVNILITNTEIFPQKMLICKK